MKAYLISLAVGVLVGVIYNLLNVRSPAPPVIALIGLAGMLAGEQLIPVGKHILTGSAFASAWHKAGGAEHVFGALPGHGQGSKASPTPTPQEKES